MKHLDRCVGWVADADASTEAASDRDGFLSYHAETHALGMGMGAGFAATAFGLVRAVGLVYAAAVHGRVGQSAGKRRPAVQDVREAPAYALAGVVVGALLGVVTRRLTPMLGG